MRVLLKVPHDCANMLSRIQWKDRFDEIVVDAQFNIHKVPKDLLPSFDDSHEHYLERHYK